MGHVPAWLSPDWSPSWLSGDRWKSPLSSMLAVPRGGSLMPPKPRANGDSLSVCSVTTTTPPARARPCSVR